MGAWNWTWVLWKNSQCSQPLSDFFSPLFCSIRRVCVHEHMHRAVYWTQVSSACLARTWPLTCMPPQFSCFLDSFVLYLIYCVLALDLRNAWGFCCCCCCFFWCDKYFRVTTGNDLFGLLAQSFQSMWHAAHCLWALLRVWLSQACSLRGVQEALMKQEVARDSTTFKGTTPVTPSRSYLSHWLHL